MPAIDELELIPLEEMERRYLRRAVARFHGDKCELAEKLGVSERTIASGRSCARGVNG